MNKEDFLDVVNIQGKLILVGASKDDEYFIEYTDGNYLRVEPITYPYLDSLEVKFGTYDKCDSYLLLTDPLFVENGGTFPRCKLGGNHGYCRVGCPYYDSHKYHFNKLVDLGIITSEGIVTPDYSDIITQK
jgi:hypothetical protein